VSQAIIHNLPMGLILRFPALRTTPGGGARMSQDPGRSAIERARTGDREAFGQVFREHEQDVLRLCRRMLGDDASAQDARSETFLRAQRAIESYDATHPVRAWLLGIAAHHCIDLVRRRSTEKRLFDDAGADPADLADGGPSPLTRMVRTEERLALLRAIDDLAPKYRMPLVLRHFADLDYEAIAELVGTTKGQVGTLLFRARRRLRERLGEIRR
jgi:RNA polymerase sigma-70 factor (ECF subfamily)